VEIIADHKDLKVIKLTLGKWQTNAYVIINPPTGKSAVIDVPAGAPSILKALKDTELDWIILSHAHMDHIGGLKTLREKRLATLVLNRLDYSPKLPLKPDMELCDGDRLFVGGLTIHVMHTPGHTSGSCCFQVGQYLFAGDTIFPGGPGRTGTPQDFQKIINSITTKILPLEDQTVVLPGHGPSTTLKKVKEEYAAFAARKHSEILCGDVTWES
jgi:hydroxyacylglutathione hydrolase